MINTHKKALGVMKTKFSAESSIKFIDSSLDGNKKFKKYERLDFH